MIHIERSNNNPILKPDKNKSWEALAAFNGCVVEAYDQFHMLYRAISDKQHHHGINLNLSSIGHVTSKDGIKFSDRRLFIKPELDWEIFGCEDPRITKIGKKYFIFYTGISKHPPGPENIKIGVAITEDFTNIEKHNVTSFNSKAMALFPKKIDGKITGILTVNTDYPPAKICIAFFDNEEQIWSYTYWKEWFSSLDKHVISLQRSEKDQVEVGAPPIETKQGWLIIYAHIINYLSPPMNFGIEAALLDLKDPSKVIGKTKSPLLVPEEEYELYGNVPDIVFPSGAIVQDKNLFIYYGAADTTCCLATCNLEELIEELTSR